MNRSTLLTATMLSALLPSCAPAPSAPADPPGDTSLSDTAPGDTALPKGASTNWFTTVQARIAAEAKAIHPRHGAFGADLHSIALSARFDDDGVAISGEQGQALSFHTQDWGRADSLDQPPTGACGLPPLRHRPQPWSDRPTMPPRTRLSAVYLLLTAVVGCGPPGPDTSSETCTPAYQYASLATLGTDLAGVSYCWGPDATRGRWDRDDTPTCTSDPDELASACSTSEPDAPCSTDADCDGGQCTTDGYTSCTCVATCASDADCASSESCLCASAKEEGTYGPAGASTCLPSECSSSADCDGSPCGLTEDICQQSAGFYCHAPDDACLWDSDCAGGELCEYSEPDGRWACQQMADCD